MLSSWDFKRLLERHPSIAIKLLEVLSRRLRVADERLDAVARRDREGGQQCQSCRAARCCTPSACRILGRYLSATGASGVVDAGRGSRRGRRASTSPARVGGGAVAVKVKADPYFGIDPAQDRRPGADLLPPRGRRTTRSRRSRTTSPGSPAGSSSSEADDLYYYFLALGAARGARWRALFGRAGRRVLLRAAGGARRAARASPMDAAARSGSRRTTSATRRGRCSSATTRRGTGSCRATCSRAAVPGRRSSGRVFARPRSSWTVRAGCSRPSRARVWIRPAPLSALTPQKGLE